MSNRFKNLFLTSIFLLGISATLQAKIVDRVVAKVNEDIITLSDLKREAKVLKVENPGRFGKMDINSRSALNFFLDQLISTILIKRELQKTGRDITDKEVNAAYESIKKKNHMSDKKFEEYLKQHDLTVKEYRLALKQRIERIRFFNIVIKSHITISDEEAKAYYEKHKGEFGREEKVRIAQIFVAVPPDLSKEKRLERQNLIMKIEAELYKGKSFASIMNEYKGNPFVRITSDLGWFQKKDLMKPIAEVAFKLKKGAISEVIETKSGFHIIRVLDVNRAKGRNFKDVKPEILRILYQKESEKRLDEWLKKAKKKANVEIML